MSPSRLVGAAAPVDYFVLFAI